MLGVRHGIPHRDVGQPRDVDDFSRRRGVGRPPLQGFDGQQRGDLLARADAILAAADHILARPDGATCDPADGQPADVIIVIEVADQQLQRAFAIARRRRDVG